MTEMPNGCVFLVDDDQSILRAFSRLLTMQGYDVQAFSSPANFIAKHDPSIPGCALLDIRMGDIDGLGVQEFLTRGGNSRPIIFITSCEDVPTSVRAMKAGAIDFLTKPVQESVLIAAVKSAIEMDIRLRRERSEIQEFRARREHLTPREREVMSHIVNGRLNKQIANDLNIVQKTVKVHRARVMEKMKVRSLAALVHIAERISQWEGAEKQSRGDSH